MASGQQVRRFVAIALISVAALMVRIALFSHTNSDITGFLVPWYDYIVEHGGYRALADPFSNYTPPYTYLLVAVTYLRPLISDKVAAIKLISVTFDFVAAFIMYKLVKLKHGSGAAPVVAYAAVLFAPTVILNSAFWGQSDIIYASFLLASVYYALQGRPFLTTASLGVALAFKLQAAFLGPFLLLLLIRKKVPWGYVPMLPAIYLFLVLPAALIGRPLKDLLTIYVGQTFTHRTLTMNAANLYQFIGNEYYLPAALGGLVIACVAGVSIALVARKSTVPLSRELLLKAATLSVALMPLLLPKMHDRHFFPADLIAIGLAFYCPPLILVPIIFQCTSAIAYGPFLAGREIFPLRHAGVVNALVVALLLVVYLLALYPLRARQAAAASDDGEPAQSDST